MSSPAPETICRKCNTPGTGRFCTACGAPLNSAPCHSCGQPLTPGAAFCHHCGAAAQTAAQGTAQGTGQANLAGNPAGRGTTLSSTLPWAVAGIAFLALFAMLAGKGLNARRGSGLDAPSNALPNPALDGPAAGQGMSAEGMGGGAGVRAPDISNMKPTEIAERLFNKVMLLNSQGKRDSVQFFAPMAIQAYSMVVDQQGHPLETDQRYDIGRIAEVAGALPLARAQADTILQQQPDHLLGLILAAHVAKLSGNAPALREYAAHFAKVEHQELAKKLPEYTQHRTDIDAGL